MKHNEHGMTEETVDETRLKKIKEKEILNKGREQWRLFTKLK
jgi:hypothetical protein